MMSEEANRNERVPDLVTQDDTSGVRNGARNGAVAGPDARARESMPDAERPPVLRPGSDNHEVGRGEAELPLVRDPGSDLPGILVRQGAQNLGGDDGGVPTARADDLPVRGLRGTPQSVLKQAGNALLAVAFQAANTAKRGMEEAQTDAAKAAFARITGDLVLKMYEMGYGKQVKHTFDIKSQEDLPAWEKVPPDVRAALESYLTGTPQQEEHDENESR